MSSMPADRQDRGGDTPSDASDAAEAAADTTASAPGEFDDRQAKLAALDQQGRSGASWFYWVAALSIVNSAMLLGGANRHFVIGLAVTQFVDVIGMQVGQNYPDHTKLIYAVAIGINLTIALVVAAFGWLSKRRVPAVFPIGMFLYLLDGMLFLVLGDWMSAAFHAYALFAMWSGWSAYRQMPAVEESLAWDETRSPGDIAAAGERAQSGQ